MNDNAVLPSSAVTVQSALDPPPVSVNRLHLALSAIVPVLLLLPFVNKAYHIDDPLYLWAGKQILRDPLDYYGVIANKWGTPQPLSDIMVVPPGFPYLLALVALGFGWGEVPLHMATLCAAALLGAAVYLTACRLCTRPGLATALAILTPMFMVSSTTVMTDVPLTAAFVWGVYLWLRGLERPRHALLFASAVCISLALMFKYTGITAVPLLFAYSLFATRRLGAWTWHLLVPIVVLAGYQYIEYRLYGKAQLVYSFQYVQSEYQSALVADWLQPLIGLTFLGGCLITISLLTPLLWPRRVLWTAALAVVAITGVCYAASDTLLYTTRVSKPLTLWLSAQNAVWFVSGVLVLALAPADLWRHRTKESVLLFLWVFGSFAFAAWINWSINARALLPLLAPLAILAVRRCEARGPINTWTPARQWTAGGLMAAGGAVSLILTAADYRQANIGREAARQFAADAAAYPHQYYFEDHWGFQYYMETAGIPYLDADRIQLHDRVAALLWGSANIAAYNPAFVRRVPGLEYKKSGLRWVTTMHPALCAGFYAHTRGPLPFAFGPVPPEEYVVFQVENYENR